MILVVISNVWRENPKLSPHTSICSFWLFLGTEWIDKFKKYLILTHINDEAEMRLLLSHIISFYQIICDWMSFMEIIFRFTSDL